tara:strand:+ start:2113 stop:2520 length:408 start_codon:yes stop_codon:yes gene_type:complete
MGIFGKREVFDLTDERNRRLIRESQAIERGTQRDDTGFVDLSSGSSGESSPSSNSSSGVGAFGDFFGGGGSSTPASTPSAGNSFDFLGGSASSSSTSANESHASVGHLKVKLEDVEYKLDRFLERLEKIESSLGL